MAENGDYKRKCVNERFNDLFRFFFVVAFVGFLRHYIKHRALRETETNPSRVLRARAKNVRFSVGDDGTLTRLLKQLSILRNP